MSALAHRRSAGSSSPIERTTERSTGRWRSEVGTGVIASAAATTVFLAFLLFSVQLAVTLQATSVVNAAGLDGARRVASRQVDHGDPRAVGQARLRAEERFRELVGPAADGTRFTWTIDRTSVRLRVQLDVPAILPTAFAAEVGPGAIDRTFVVRIERAP